MARRPKRINLEAVSDSTHPEHKRHCEALIMDLLRKHPRGPECKLVREDYRSSWQGHDKLRGVDDTMEWNCGYSDLLLYRLCCSMGVDGGEWDWKYKCRELFPNIGKGGHTRRSRRLAARTQGAHRRIMVAGRPGIYEVNFGYGYRRSGTVRVYAETTEMAKSVAMISFGATYQKDINDIQASFQREGCPSELMGLNGEVVNYCNNEVEKKKREIIEMQAEIERLELRAVMVQTYSIAAVAG